jgi:hypothetical protein
VLRRGRRARDVHSEDAVVVFLASLVVAFSASCAPKGPSPSAALEGERARRARDGGRTPGENDDEEDAKEDREAVAVGISIRALSCTTDHDCLTHRCDVEHKRCRFPCRDDSDCESGARCEVDAGALAACFFSRPR